MGLWKALGIRGAFAAMFVLTGAWMFAVRFAMAGTPSVFGSALVGGIFFGVPLYFACGVLFELLADGPDGIGRQRALQRVVVTEAAILVLCWVGLSLIF